MNKKKVFKINGFWHKQNLVKDYLITNHSDVRYFSGVSIKDSKGNVYNVNRCQLRKANNRKKTLIRINGKEVNLCQKR